MDEPFELNLRSLSLEQLLRIIILVIFELADRLDIRDRAPLVGLEAGVPPCATFFS